MFCHDALLFANAFLTSSVEDKLSPTLRRAGGLVFTLLRGDKPLRVALLHDGNGVELTRAGINHVVQTNRFVVHYDYLHS